MWQRERNCRRSCYLSPIIFFVYVAHCCVLSLRYHVLFRLTVVYVARLMNDEQSVVQVCTTHGSGVEVECTMDECGILNLNLPDSLAVCVRQRGTLVVVAKGSEARRKRTAFAQWLTILLSVSKIDNLSSGVCIARGGTFPQPRSCSAF